MDTKGSSALEKLLKTHNEVNKQHTQLIKIEDYCKGKNILQPKDRWSELEKIKTLEKLTEDYLKQKAKEENEEENEEVTKSTKPREETKTKIKTPTSHSNKRSYTGNKKQRVAAWAAMAIIMFLAGKGIISNINTQDEQVNASTPVKMALENGANLETLGIDDTIFTEIKEIEAQLANDDLTNIEILKLAPRINAVYFDIVKGKIANTLGVKKHDIKIYEDTDHEGKPTQRIEVSDGRIYVNEDFLTSKNTFSKEISGAINGIASMQGTLSKLDFDNINREELINELNTILNNAGEFASYKIEIDENGYISARPFTRDDLDQYDKAVYDSINISTVDRQNDMDER